MLAVAPSRKQEAYLDLLARCGPIALGFSVADMMAQHGWGLVGLQWGRGRRYREHIIGAVMEDGYGVVWRSGVDGVWTPSYVPGDSPIRKV